MAERRLVYFTGESHRVYRARGGTLALEGEFGGDDAGVAAFREYLGGHRGSLFALLADLVGEDFHEDQIPYLRGADRDAVVQRRLAQRYRDTRLAAALPLGAVSGERRNERLLLASFTNTQQFTPWLAALEDSGAKLAGVYSVPLLAPALAARLGEKSGRAFVVTLDGAGLRQSFVEDGRLRFSRLERTVEMRPEAVPMFVRSETLRLAQYLTTLRALPREGAPVRVVVVAPPGQRALFEQALVADARLAFRVVDAAQAARAAGLRGAPGGALGEALYLHLAAKRPPREQFASRDDRRRYVVWQLQRATVAAGAAGFLACAAYAGSLWLDAWSVAGQAAGFEQQARAAAQSYARITAGFPVTQTSTENLKATVVEFTRIAQHSASPETAFVHISQALEDFPQIEIDGIQWDAGGKAARAGPAPARQPSAASADGVEVEISGQVNAAQRNDYRGITAQVQRFAAALATPPYTLVRTKLPFDITPEGTLTGDIGREADSGAPPRFTVTIARKLP